MLLKFDAEKSVALIHYTENSKAHRSRNGLKETAIPCLWLMGEQGLCLTSSGLPTPCCDDMGEPTCLFAVGGAPEDGFDRWWALKRATLGEASVAFISMAVAKSAIKGKYMALDVTPHGESPRIKVARGVSDIAVLPWNHSYRERAVKQGWDISEGHIIAVNPKAYSLRWQKPKFKSNDDAAVFLKEMARQGNDVAIYAISVLSSMNSNDVALYGLKEALRASFDR